MSFSLFSLPISLVFVLYGLAVFHHAASLRREEDPRKRNFIDNTTLPNEILVGSLFIASAILYPLVYFPTNATPEAARALFFVSTILILGVSSIWWIWGLIGKVNCERDPSLKRCRLDEEDAILEKYAGSFEMTVSVDAKRKFLHVLPGLVIVVVELLSWISLWTGMIDVLPVAITRQQLAYLGETSIAFMFVFMIGFADWLRLSNRFHWLPTFAKRWFFSSIHEREAASFVSSCPLVLTLLPFMFAPMPVFVSVAFMSSLADAAASLVGRKWGKHHFPRGSKKTVEGYIAGVSSAFCIVLICSLVFNYDGWGIMKILGVAVAGSVTFFLLDLLVRGVSDNILNPLVCGGAMVLVAFLI